jgi:hypothetical protein
MGVVWVKFGYTVIVIVPVLSADPVKLGCR